MAYLDVPLLVGDDAEARHLRPRPRSCIDRHHGHHRMFGLVDALEIRDDAVGVPRHEAYSLGCIVRRSAPDADDPFASLLRKKPGTLLDLPACGIG